MRPFTPPASFAAAKARSMPVFMPRPSSLAGPENGAAMPKTISACVTPWTAGRARTSGWRCAASVACLAVAAAASCCERHHSAPPTAAAAMAALARMMGKEERRCGDGGGCFLGITIFSGPAAVAPAPFPAPFCASSSDTISSRSSLLHDSQMVRFLALTFSSTWNSPSRRRIARRTASMPPISPKRASMISPFSMNTTTSCSGPAGETTVRAAVCRLML